MDDPSSHHASGSTVQSFGSSITLPPQAKSTDLSSVSRAPSQGFDVRGGREVCRVPFKLFTQLPAKQRGTVDMWYG